MKPIHFHTFHKTLFQKTMIFIMKFVRLLLKTTTTTNTLTSLFVEAWATSHLFQEAAEAEAVYNKAIQCTLENTEALEMPVKTVTVRADSLCDYRGGLLSDLEKISWCLIFGYFCSFHSFIFIIFIVCTILMFLLWFQCLQFGSSLQFVQFYNVDSFCICPFYQTF